MCVILYGLSSSATPNLFDDMQNQIRANQVRIDLLKEQNDSLQGSLSQLKPTNERSAQTTKKPTPLFLLNNEIVQHQQQAFTEIRFDRHHRLTELEVGHRRPVTVATHPASKQNTGRASSATRHPAQRDVVAPKSSRSSSSARQSRPTPRGSYPCPNCNRSYEDKRNYDIHKLYCKTSHTHQETH